MQFTSSVLFHRVVAGESVTFCKRFGLWESLLYRFKSPSSVSRGYVKESRHTQTFGYEANKIKQGNLLDMFLYNEIDVEEFGKPWLRQIFKS